MTKEITTKNNNKEVSNTTSQSFTPTFFILKKKSSLSFTQIDWKLYNQILVLLFMGNCSFPIRRQVDNMPFIQKCICSTLNLLQYTKDYVNSLNVYGGIIPINLQNMVKCLPSE